MTAAYYVISGGPGAGKSALLEALALRGYNTVPEAGRAIIRLQTGINGQGVPWDNPMLYTELMLIWELRTYMEAQAIKEPVFFDRGLPDLCGYLKVCGLPVPEHIINAVRNYRYNRNVFLAPPWQEIYAHDAERKQSWQEACATFERMVEVYKCFNYNIIYLPKCDLVTRVDFILDHIC